MARDILLTQISAGVFDLLTQDDDLVGDESLGTAVLISLFTDARADADDLPPEWKDPRGWWADAMLATASRDFQGVGSRLWLLARQKQTTEVVARAEDYARQALQWLIDDGTVSAVNVTADAPSMGLLTLEVAVTHTDPKATQRSTSRWTISMDEQQISMRAAV